MMVVQTQTNTIEAILDEIGRRLQAELGQLFPPLSNVALAHVRDVRPYMRAAIVVAVASAVEERAASSARDTDAAGVALREQALILGSALEMLAVALSIHRLLLMPVTGDSLDRALVGSTILTGDYCFSRAASLAAQTESPRVVELFSRALQQVSEASLRELFGGVAEEHEEDVALVTAGVQAICFLGNVDETSTVGYLAFARALAARDWAQVETPSNGNISNEDALATLLEWATSLLRA